MITQFKLFRRRWPLCDISRHIYLRGQDQVRPQINRQVWERVFMRVECNVWDLGMETVQPQVKQALQQESF